MMHQECVKKITRQKFELETLKAVKRHVKLLENYGLRFEIMHFFSTRNTIVLNSTLGLMSS